MVDSAKLQRKLLDALRGSSLHLQLPNRQWNELELREAASMVQDYVNRRDSVIESEDALRDWLDRYRFSTATQQGG
jgi:hypothetical protein